MIVDVTSGYTSRPGEIIGSPISKTSAEPTPFVKTVEKKRKREERADIERYLRTLFDPLLNEKGFNEKERDIELRGAKLKEPLSRLVEKYKNIKAINEELEKVRIESKRVNKQYVDLKKYGVLGEELSLIGEKGKELNRKETLILQELNKKEKDLYDLAIRIPNAILPGVPVGKNENDNVEIRKWGKIPEFDFTPKPYYELSEILDTVDTERASKVSGSRFGYIKNEGVLLEFALVNWGLKTLIEKGFTPIIPPVLIRKDVMRKLGYNNFGFQETYCIGDSSVDDDEKLCLIATAEHALVPYHMDEILREEDLPKRFVGFSSAFRREAGAYGKDVRGIMRVHQFNKLEMVSFTRPEDSEKEHEFMLSLEEELMQKLNLPYHVVQMCTGDLGDPTAAKFDIEAWFPSEERYRETHSCSNTTDYQAKRLNIRFKRKTGETEYVHILNGTVFSERPILAILENYQEADGSVKVPEVLEDYVGQKVISPKS
jgi:seryl-tRNA synthetase